MFPLFIYCIDIEISIDSENLEMFCGQSLSIDDKIIKISLSISGRVRIFNILQLAQL